MHNQEITNVDQNRGFNLRLGAALFSDPQRDRSNAVVVANIPDEVAKIKAGDLVRIDFTTNQLADDGLYIITLDDGWIGYRFFQRMPSWHIREDTGIYPVTASMQKSIKVVGRVKGIYRSQS